MPLLAEQKRFCRNKFTPARVKDKVNFHAKIFPKFALVAQK